MAENILSGECDVIEADELAGLVASGWTLLDVRTPSECARGMIPGGVVAPLDTLREQLPTLGPGPFAVYCQVGQRGHTATELLHELGLVARNLDGGYTTWLAAEAARTGDVGPVTRSGD
jgi:rhodanese-related sulfurtransferase